MSASMVIVIVGPTGSGKSRLALQIAAQHTGEIIAADSRTVYRGMDIGTAKPSDKEQAAIPHHLINVVDPNQSFTVADFQVRARHIINDISNRNKLPIIAGGTGLYVSALVYDYELRPGAEAGDLAERSTAELQGLASHGGIELNESDVGNRRRLIRALQTAGAQPGRRMELPEGWLLIGLNPGWQELERRLAERTEDWFASGLASEAERLFARYSDVEALNTVPYTEVREMLSGGAATEATKALINTHLRQLAKRQLTWFKGNADIIWKPSVAEARAEIDRWLASGL